jgi:hypothetical protein
MSQRTGKINTLPDGFSACSNCSRGGAGAFTLLVERKVQQSGVTLIKHVFSHWCDKGRPLTGEEVFTKGARAGFGDINLETEPGGSIGDLQETWNTMNKQNAA